jgi:hypothetical protein
MPAENPPQIFRTPDNREWKFVQTFADYVQMNKFRRKSRCRLIAGREYNRRIRLPCNCRRSLNSCQFQLLALRTTSEGYHVYTFGEHKHPGHQQKQQEQGMEVDEEEEEDGDVQVEDDEEGEDNEEDEEKGDLEEGEDQDQPEIKQEGSMEIIETPLGNEATLREEITPREEIPELEEKLSKAQAKVYNWMAGIEPNQIGPTLGKWDNSYLRKMVEMADQEIRENSEKSHLNNYNIYFTFVLIHLQIQFVASLAQICHQEMHVHRRGNQMSGWMALILLKF